jgi:hypothetical protein
MVLSIDHDYPFELSVALKHPSSILKHHPSVYLALHVLLFIPEVRLDLSNLTVFIM